jgi:hypothetical protein
MCAMALSGYDPTNALWLATCRSLVLEIDDPYIKAMVGRLFLFCFSLGSVWVRIWIFCFVFCISFSFGLVMDSVLLL